MTGMPRPLSLIPDGFLKFGIFLAPFHPVGENPTLAMERDMQLLEHLDMLGYDEAWIGEHHPADSRSSPARRSSSPAPPRARATSGWAPASCRCPITIRSPWRAGRRCSTT